MLQTMTWTCPALVRGPTPPPPIRKHPAKRCLHALPLKVRTNFCLLPYDMSQEASRNGSETLAQVNLFSLDDIFGTDFPSLIRVRQVAIRNSAWDLGCLTLTFWVLAALLRCLTIKFGSPTQPPPPAPNVLLDRFSACFPEKDLIH